MLLRKISNLPMNVNRFVRFSARKPLPVVPGVSRSGELPVIVHPPALMISDRSQGRSAWWLYDGRNGMIHHVLGEHDIPHGNVYYLTSNIDVPNAVLIGTLKEGIEVEKGELIYRNDSDYMVLFHLADRTIFRVVRASEFGDWKDRYGYYSKNSLPLALIPMPNRPDPLSLRVLSKLSSMVPLVKGSAVYRASSHFTLETPLMTTYLEDLYFHTFDAITSPTDEEISATVEGLPFPWVIELDPSVHSAYGLFMEFTEGRWLLHTIKRDSSFSAGVDHYPVYWYPGASVGFEDALDLVQTVATACGGSAFVVMDPSRIYLKYYRLGSASIHTHLLVAWVRLDGQMHLVLPLPKPVSDMTRAWARQEPKD